MKIATLLFLSALIVVSCGRATAQTPAAAPTALPATVASSPIPTALPTATEAPPTALPTATEAPPTALPAATPAPTSFPSPTAAPTASAAAKAPVRIVIDAIGMDRKIVPVGLDRNRIPIVPEHDVGWFNLSAAPGQSENVVLWGHVLRFRKARNIPAPFAEMKNLKIGETIELYDDLGVAHDYVVTRQIKVRPTEVKYILQQGREMVTMVSCIGDDILSPDGGVVDKTHRLITIAEPAG